MFEDGKPAVRTSDFNLGTQRGVVVRVAGMGPGAVPVVTTAIITAVADSASEVQILAEASSRVKFSITNDSTADLYLAIGGQTASTTVYTIKIAAGGGYFESVNDVATACEVRGIWASDPNTGAARITSYFA